MLYRLSYSRSSRWPRSGKMIARRLDSEDGTVAARSESAGLAPVAAAACATVPGDPAPHGGRLSVW